MGINNHEERITHILHYIDNNLHQNLSVNLLADKSGWSRWQLQRVFSAHTGLNVAQYVRELRLGMAAWKLVSSPDKHLDIALVCGFESEVSFSRSFKQYFGCPPRDYRQAANFTGVRTIFKEKIAMHQKVKC